LIYQYYNNNKNENYSKKDNKKYISILPQRNKTKILQNRFIKKVEITNNIPQSIPQTSSHRSIPLISRDRPIRRLTPRYEVPNEMMMEQDEIIREKKYGGKWTSP
jgi:hypothetical protein